MYVAETANELANLAKFGKVGKLQITIVNILVFIFPSKMYLCLCVTTSLI